MKVEANCAYCGKLFISPQWKGSRFCSKSCGAHTSKNKRHGYSGTREHATWLDMRNRCRNPDAHNYARYGGRGIEVCERWDTFENFLADMGPKPGKGYSIERMDNDGNYEPSNCKWATQLEQNRNKRNVYTAEEDQKIREAIALGYNFPQMAAFVGRSEKGVTARTYRLGLSSGQSVPTKITDRTPELSSTDRGTP